MPALESDLRRQLENVIIQARDVAEGAARSAIQKRAVDAAEPFSHFGPKEKELRTRLRARGRQAGDVRNDDKTQSIEQLTQELAYEFWHRMLFARFLAENHLLMHPDGVAVSLEECEELAPTADPPAVNGFVLAARYASTMLPQIFRTDDVLLEIDFAPEQRLALERLLASLPQKVFLADDSLGWGYQFWQSKKKEEVNKSGDKIDGRTLSTVTQLFTEDYMVQFLLHNTIGAWWSGRHNIKGPPGEAGIPAGKSPLEMEYLRWHEDGTPAAGTFEGWPKSLAEFTMLDPCCGSGHFLVAAFNMLVPLRMYDEKLTAKDACAAVLRDNLFGLELDPRCTQIAAFALALAAWKYPDAGGYRPLPTMNIACSGQGVMGKEDEWLGLANGNDRLREGMGRLYDLFQQAPQLGSLIDPRHEKGSMYEAGYAELQPLLSKALAKHVGDADLTAVGVAAQGIAKAAEFLGRHYILVMTNVPYLGRLKQNDAMKGYSETWYAEGKADLSTAFLMRCLALTAPNGTTALVSPQNWLFLTSYTKLRVKLLKQQTWTLVASLGEEAWWTFGMRGPRTVLTIFNNCHPRADDTFYALDVSTNRGQTPILLEEKAERLSSRKPLSGIVLAQNKQLENPDSSIVFEANRQSVMLGEYADSFQGAATLDIEQFRLCFFELPDCTGWHYHQSTPTGKEMFSGAHYVSVDREPGGRFYRMVELLESEKRAGAPYAGKKVWGKKGVACGWMGYLPAAIYLGAVFDNSIAAIVPRNPDHLLAIWCYCSSPEYVTEVRKINQKNQVANATLVKVPFDLARWQAAAAQKYPNGFPEPHSDDPTQWLFKGDISKCTEPLQVAVARLLGYSWPEQQKAKDTIDGLADTDGIVCLPGVRGEAAASERVLEVLHAAYGDDWSDSVLHKLLTNAGCKAGTTLDDWLSNYFFEQHCKCFYDRPFIWHIWDGRKDGFSALVNYHKLDHKALENLTYAYLGDWITAQSKSDKAGADLRMGAAQELQAKLKMILAGEPPYDIFVRWKPIQDQPIGWHPDLNDGLRMNIRPFMAADILRKLPNIKLTKDRGKEPEQSKSDYPWLWSGNEFVGDRVNDVHLTNAEKQAARSRNKGAK